MKINFGRIVRVAIKVAPTLIAAVPIVKAAAGQIKTAVREDKAMRGERG